MTAKLKGEMVTELAAKRALHKALRRAMDKVGFLILPEARNRCPIRTGALRNSGMVETVTKESYIGCDLSFGDDKVTYALKMHELETYRLGKLSASMGPQVGPKFATRAVYENGKQIEEIVSDGCKEGKGLIVQSPMSTVNA